MCGVVFFLLCNHKIKNNLSGSKIMKMFNFTSVPWCWATLKVKKKIQLFCKCVHGYCLCLFFFLFLTEGWTKRPELKNDKDPQRWNGYRTSSAVPHSKQQHRLNDPKKHKGRSWSIHRKTISMLVFYCNYA